VTFSSDRILKAEECGGGDPRPSGTYTDGEIINGGWKRSPSGLYYYSYGDSSQHWGLHPIYNIAVGVAQDFYDNDPDNRTLGFGATAVFGGGEIPGSVSHQTVEDMDLRYIRTDGAQSPVTISSGYFDQDASMDAINRAAASEYTRNVFTADTTIVNQDTTGKILEAPADTACWHWRWERLPQYQ